LSVSGQTKVELNTRAHFGRCLISNAASLLNTG
jgi:hypothetical protein